MVLITAGLHLDAWMREGRDPFASVAPIISCLDGLIIAGDPANNPMYQWPRALARIGTHRPDGWFFSHTHRQFSGNIHGVPINNISFGYPDEIADSMEAELLLRELVAITA